MSDDDYTSSQMRDETRGRGMSDKADAWAAGAWVIGAVLFLAVLRGGFRGRMF